MMSDSIEIHMRDNCIGTFRIHLDHLSWGPTAYLDPKNVKRLERTLKDDCRRLLGENYISAIVDRTIFDRTEKHVEEGLLAKVCFDSSFRLLCLNGKHRIAAAREVLHGQDRWWSVTLYADS